MACIVSLVVATTTNAKKISDIVIEANRGDANAQYELAKIYDTGNGYPKDKCEAYKWYKKAALSGHADAQNALGVIYEYGICIQKDKFEAFKWYLYASANGNKQAYSNLKEFSTPQVYILLIITLLIILLYINYRKNEPQRRERERKAIEMEKQEQERQRKQAIELERKREENERKAKAVFEANRRQLVERAMVQNNGYAQLELAMKYFLGDGFPQDFKNARSLIQEAAKQDVIEAQLILGLMYEEGFAIRQDNELALEMYGKACDNGNILGCENYKRMKKQLSSPININFTIKQESFLDKIKEFIKK